MPLLGVALDDILCIQVELTVGSDNCVSYEARTLQIPTDKHRSLRQGARERQPPSCHATGPWGFECPWPWTSAKADDSRATKAKQVGNTVDAKSYWSAGS